MERYLTVANLGDAQGGWNLSAFDDLSADPADIIQKINSMSGQRADRGDDTVA